MDDAAKRKLYLRIYGTTPLLVIVFYFIVLRFRDKLSLARSLVGAVLMGVFVGVVVGLASFILFRVAKRTTQTSGNLQATLLGASFAWKANYKPSPLQNARGVLAIYKDRVVLQPKSSHKPSLMINQSDIKSWSGSKTTAATYDGQGVPLIINTTDGKTYKFYLLYVPLTEYDKALNAMQLLCPQSPIASSSPQ